MCIIGRWEGLLFAGAVGADAFEHEVDRFELVAFAEREVWNLDVVKADGALADTAVEMRVLVVVGVVAAAVAQLVLRVPAPVLYGMHYVGTEEKIEHAEDARFVERVDGLLELYKSERAFRAHQLPHDYEAVWRRSDAGGFKYLFCSEFHKAKISIIVGFRAFTVFYESRLKTCRVMLILLQRCCILWWCNNSVICIMCCKAQKNNIIRINSKKVFCN